MEKLQRPKIAIKLTFRDKIIEILSIALLIGYWSYTLFQFNNLPEIIPTHFNGSGAVDGYGAKGTILILPMIATLFFVFLTLLIRFPHKFNYQQIITVKNATKIYTTATKMLRVLKLVLITIFFAIDYKTIQIALGKVEVAGGLFLFGIFGLVFGWIFYFLILMSKHQ
jgi:uncharacterized membrane protein